MDSTRRDSGGAPPSDELGASGALERLREAGFRDSRQRTAIIEAFFACNRKMTSEELRGYLRTRTINASTTTVYRTLRALADHGLATAWQDGNAQARFEPAARERHHGRLVCTRCRTAVAFVEDEVERVEKLVARRSGFEIRARHLKFYGVCERCRRNEGSVDER